LSLIKHKSYKFGDRTGTKMAQSIEMIDDGHDVDDNNNNNNNNNNLTKQDH